MSLDGRLATCLTLLLLLGAVFSPRIIPYDMDEFAHYQPLGCAEFPLSRAHNIYREACGQYDLRLPLTHTFLPLRSYLYIGSLPVVPFYPFWWLLRDPVAARLQGVVFFLASGWLLAQIGGAPPLLGIASGLILPAYFFSVLVDTGPVGISILLLLGSVRLLQGVPSSRRPTLRSALCGLTLFLGMLVKPVFGWALPALGLYAWLRVRPKGLLALAGTFLVPLVVLGFSEDRDGNRYFELLRLGGVSHAAGSLITVLGHFVSFLCRPSEILPRILQIRAHFTDTLFPGLAIGLSLFALKVGGDAALFLGLGLLTLASTLFTGSAYWPHHFGFVGVFLILAFTRTLAALPGRLRWPVLGLVIALELGLWMRLPTAVEFPETNHDKDHLLAFIRREGLDRRFVQVHTAWGTFYISHLFGAKDQDVLYFRFREWTESPAHVSAVRALAIQEGRGVLVITSRPEGLSDTPVVQAALGPVLRRYTFGNWEALEYLLR